MKSFFAMLGLAFFALTWIATPVAIIWLIVKGVWWPLGVLLFGLFSHFLISLAIMPSLLFAAPALLVAKRHPLIGILIGLPSVVYIAALITIWCVGSMLFMLNRATPDTWIPLLILSFSLGTGPWNYMASKEAQGQQPGESAPGSAVATLFMNVAFLVTMLYVILARPTNAAPLWLIFGGIMALESLAAATIAVLTVKEEAERSRRMAEWASLDEP